MVPGSSGHQELLRLGMAHGMASHKEDKFVSQVFAMGLHLPVRLQELHLESLNKKHFCVPLPVLASHILERYPQKLLAGHTIDEKNAFFEDMRNFWQA